jgi:alpha-L-fucosidase
MRICPLTSVLLPFGLVVFSGCAPGQPHQTTTRPTAYPGESRAQQRLSERGYGMFLHFGINTFNQTEWSDGKLRASSYHPTQLDPDSWVRVAKGAGFRHVVLVTKHHDGFCLWDSAVTDYDVASSPVKTDVVAAVAKACRKHGVELGLYYSLWDRHEPSHQDKDPERYVAYMRAQLTELLSHYGPICEVWFDGGWAKKREDWNIPSLYQLIHQLQPDCAVTVNHTIGIGTNANKLALPANYAEGDVIRFWPVDFRTKDPNFVRTDDPKFYTFAGERHYLPFEHTVCLSDRWNWFQKKDVLPARPVDELEEIFYWGTANRNALLINVPPDQTGRLRENEVQAILQLADRLGIRGGGNPLPKRGPNLLERAAVNPTNALAAVDTSLETSWRAHAVPAVLEITPAKPVSFDRMTLVETADIKDLGDGFSQERHYRVQRFTIEARTPVGWQQLYAGEKIGSALALNLPRTTADQLRITIQAATGPAGFDHIGAYDSRDYGRRLAANGGRSCKQSCVCWAITTARSPCL